MLSRVGRAHAGRRTGGKTFSKRRDYNKPRERRTIPRGRARRTGGALSQEEAAAAAAALEAASKREGARLV